MPLNFTIRHTTTQELSFIIDGQHIKPAPTASGNPNERESQPGKPTTIERYKQMIAWAWEYADKAMIEGKPYLSRQALKKYLANNEGMKATTIDQYLIPAAGRLIGKLIDCGHIEPHGKEGWFIIGEPDTLVELDTVEHMDA